MPTPERTRDFAARNLAAQIIRERGRIQTDVYRQLAITRGTQTLPLTEYLIGEAAAPLAAAMVDGHQYLLTGRIESETTLAAINVVNDEVWRLLGKLIVEEHVLVRKAAKYELWHWFDQMLRAAHHPSVRASLKKGVPWDKTGHDTKGYAAYMREQAWRVEGDSTDDVEDTEFLGVGVSDDNPLLSSFWEWMWEERCELSHGNRILTLFAKAERPRLVEAQLYYRVDGFLQRELELQWKVDPGSRPDASWGDDNGPTLADVVASADSLGSPDTIAIARVDLNALLRELLVAARDRKISPLAMLIFVAETFRPEPWWDGLDEGGGTDQKMHRVLARLRDRRDLLRSGLEIDGLDEALMTEYVDYFSHGFDLQETGPIAKSTVKNLRDRFKEIAFAVVRRSIPFNAFPVWKSDAFQAWYGSLNHTRKTSVNASLDRLLFHGHRLGRPRSHTLLGRDVGLSGPAAKQFILMEDGLPLRELREFDEKPRDNRYRFRILYVVRTDLPVGRKQVVLLDVTWIASAGKDAERKTKAATKRRRALGEEGDHDEEMEDAAWRLADDLELEATWRAWRLGAIERVRSIYRDEYLPDIEEPTW